MNQCSKHNYPYSIMCPLCAIDRILGTIAPASRNTHTTPEPFPASDEQERNVAYLPCNHIVKVTGEAPKDCPTCAKRETYTLNPQYQDFLSRNPEYARELDARKGEDAAAVDALIRSDPRVK